MTDQQSSIPASGGLTKQYDPLSIEQPIYNRWLSAGYFHPRVTPGSPRYCITIPPPNVTGELHMGHGLCYTVHDVLVRWKRMQGFTTLCLPGTDHAGIGTQNVVERMLAAEGISRHDLGREAFVGRVWEWKAKYGAAIIGQLKKLGCSFDWERERFTMDAGYSDAVLDAFIHLFNKGYIYRGARVTHWCPRCQTALSDIEVDDQEQAGSLWYFRYPVENGYAFGTEHLVIATTRPETMLGDTAVAVHPDDRRYQHLIGKMVELPLTGRRIPIIADPVLVDMEFGTGALKVTPAHDLNDFEAGERNSLPSITVIGTDGRMTPAAGSFASLDRFEAREAVVRAMENGDLLDHIEDYSVTLPICDRCKTVLEPLLSEQWYCRMKELAAPAIEAVRGGDTRFVPDRWAQVYLDWMDKLRDWCVSRQLWWGHRIPIYHCASCKNTVAARRAPEACEKCGGVCEQDPDVLDTWFSSALWPFATLGWPEKTPELEYFYPTDVLITARDIIYLWVARMLMMGLEFMGEIPFPDVYIYATVLDAKGDRMSKSKGNGIDPIALVDAYGADATRYGIVTQAGKSQQIRFSENIVAQARLFCSKIWQASRFVLMNLAEGDISSGSTEHSERLEDRWIRSRVADAVQAVNEGLASYDLDVATRVLHEFVWSEFCDWYIELAKPRLASGEGAVREQLREILDTTLRLLHPFMPFLTEEIWQQLPGHGETLVSAAFPKPDPSAIDREAEDSMSALMDVVVRIRNMRSELKLAPGLRIPVFLSGLPADLQPWLDIVEGRGRCTVSLEDEAGADSPQGAASSSGAGAEDRSAVSTAAGIRIRIPLRGLVDFDKEKARLTAEIASIVKEIESIEKQFANPQFLCRAPEAVVSEKRERLERLKSRRAEAEGAREKTGGLK